MASDVLTTHRGSLLLGIIVRAFSGGRRRALAVQSTNAADFTTTKLKDGRVLIISGPTNPMPPFNYAGAELFRVGSASCPGDRPVA